MRVDPDILVIGEVCDEITVKAAFQGAKSGITVFSTCQGAQGGVTERLEDMGSPFRDIEQNLVG